MSKQKQILYFFSESCHSCNYVSLVLQKHSVPHLPVNVDDEIYYDMVADYNIVSVPTIIICEGDTEIHRILAGNYEETELIDKLKDFYENN